MIKLFSFRKIAIASLLLLLAGILYNYPEEINENVVKEDHQCTNIYLINSDDYVVMSKINVSHNIDEKVLTIINLLINGKGDLKGVLPENTQLLDYSIENDLIKLNFSKEFLNVSLKDEENMIISLIYSFASLDNIDKIMIFVEGEKLNELPNSHKILGLYLDKSYGINKVININSISDTKQITVYYPTEFEYYIPVSYVLNSNEDAIDIIISYSKTNKFYNDNLSSHLDYQVKLMNYEAFENEIYLNFNEVLFDSVYDGKLKEEVKYALAYSIFDTLGVKNVVFAINSLEIDEFGLAK
jgi:germination protein M